LIAAIVGRIDVRTIIYKIKSKIETAVHVFVNEKAKLKAKPQIKASKQSLKAKSQSKASKQSLKAKAQRDDRSKVDGLSSR